MIGRKRLNIKEEKKRKEKKRKEKKRKEKKRKEKKIILYQENDDCLFLRMA